MIKFLTTMATVVALTVTPAFAAPSFIDILGADNWGFSNEHGGFEKLHTQWGDDFKAETQLWKDVDEAGEISYKIFVDADINSDTSRIVEGYLGKISQWGDSDYAVQMYLNSPGGEITAAEDIVFAIKESSVAVQTIISKAQRCSSACSLIFMAGDFRNFHDHKARLGVHAPYIGDDSSQNCNTSDKMRARVSAMLNDNISKEDKEFFLKRMFNRCGDIHFFSDTEEKRFSN